MRINRLITIFTFGIAVNELIRMRAQQHCEAHQLLHHLGRVCAQLEKQRGQALEALALDEVRWIPAGQPWQKARDVTAARHRVAMVERAIAGEPHFVLDRTEVDRSGPSFTLDTVREWADAIASTNAKVRDTRKTTPGMRALEKYAVRCGGGVNHRMSLSDAALVKDNHIVAAGGVAEAFAAVRAAAPSIVLEIEVDTIDQLRMALAAGADLVLLDNMKPDVLREAVAIAAQHLASTGRAVVLEASGGLTLENAQSVAATGVNYISVGALTHSAKVLDIGLDLETIVA